MTNAANQIATYVRQAREANWRANACVRQGFGGAAHSNRMFRNDSMRAARQVRA